MSNRGKIILTSGITEQRNESKLRKLATFFKKEIKIKVYYFCLLGKEEKKTRR